MKSLPSQCLASLEACLHLGSVTKDESLGFALRSLPRSLLSLIFDTHSLPVSGRHASI